MRAGKLSVRARHGGLSLLSGLILGLAFPPFDFAPLVLVAPIPLLWVWRDGVIKGLAPWRSALSALVAGTGFFAVLCWWAWYFGAVAYLPFAFVLGLYWAGAGAVIGRLGTRGIRGPWVSAIVWVTFEALRSRWPYGGFSWGEIGYGYHDFPPARALASVGGVPLVSLLSIACSGLLLEICVWVRRPTSRAALLRLSIGAIGIVVIGAVAFATWYSPASTGTISVALLQGNDQNRYLSEEELASRYLPNSHFELAESLVGQFDLIVFPESSMDADLGVDDDLAARISAVALAHKSTVLANATVEKNDGGLLNTNFFFSTSGKLEGTYAKRHLVPFGEYVPLRSQLGFIDALDQIPNDYVSGPGPVQFNVGGHPVATLICFEAAFSPLFREASTNGAEIVVLSTNNRSYRRSGNSAQHLAISQMRAAEIGRPVLQASISGMSAVIDARGGLHQRTELFEKTVIVADVELKTGRTPFVRFGDWVGIGSVFITIGLLLKASGIFRLLSRHQRNS